MSQQDNRVLLADTNAAYKLFFFMQKGIFPKISISIENLGDLYIHPIVLEEVETHVELWRVKEEYDYAMDEIPSFFKEIDQKLIYEILEFVKNNLHPDHVLLDSNDEQFLRKRRVYEVERKRLQKGWRETGVQGNKVNSKPSMNDYKLLYAVDEKKCKICTHDEILLAVAQEFLEEGDTLKTEDIINQIYRNNPSLKDDIERAIDNLQYLREQINPSKIFRLD